MVRLIRLIGALLELALVAWSTYQVIALLLEWWRSPSPGGIPDNGYPNEWGVRTAPLTPGELEAALQAERAIALRRLAELVDDPVGSAAPAARASTTTVRPAGT